MWSPRGTPFLCPLRTGQTGVQGGAPRAGEGGQTGTKEHGVTYSGEDPRDAATRLACGPPYECRGGQGHGRVTRSRGRATPASGAGTRDREDRMPLDLTTLQASGMRPGSARHPGSPPRASSPPAHLAWRHSHNARLSACSPVHAYRIHREYPRPPSLNTQRSLSFDVRGLVLPPCSSQTDSVPRRPEQNFTRRL